jgi:hypothetical protein
MARIGKLFDFNLRGISKWWFDVPLKALALQQEIRKAG